MYSLIIVDDEAITQMAVSGFVQRSQLRFSVDGIFSNGVDALKYIQTHPVNVVITDIRMPRMDGLELARQIYETYPGITVIIISGYGEFEYARKAICYGVANYLLKPLDFEELRNTLRHTAEKLDTLDAETSVEDENIQLFFIDLMGGMIADQQTLNDRYAELSFPGMPADHNGCIFTLTLNKDDLTAWKYGREKLAVALTNALRISYGDYQIYHLFRSGLKYYFVLLSEKERELPVPDEQWIGNILFHMLHFTAALQLQSTFHGLQSLLNTDVTAKETALSTQTPSVPDDDIIIHKAMSYIQQHYNEDLTREDVADAVFLSSAYFSRFFKQKTGLSFIDYLTTVRMQKAIELLGTRMKVGEIANKVGYLSRNRFFINFRQYSGYTPTEYRKQILRMEDMHEEAD